MRDVGKGTLAMVGIVLAVLLLWVGVYAFRWVTAEPRGKLQAREAIQSGDFRIAAYNHFYDLCASVQAVEATLDASMTELETAPADDKQRIRTNITGLIGQRARSIAEYNVDARKSYTAGQFRATDLPYQLDSAAFQKGTRTLCEN